jgi:cytochrome c-type biogenesis protein CcmH
MNLRLAWSVLAVVVVAAVVVAATQGGDPSTTERVRHLSEEIQCPECDGVSVAQSLAPTSRAIRRDLRRRVEAGQTDDEIRAAYSDRYGEAILLEPGGSGLGVLVWGLPAVLLVVGAGALVLVWRRRRDEPLLHATDADERLVETTRRSEPS